MKENIKIGLLGIIALTLVVDTFFMGESNSSSTIEPTNNIVSNVAATQPNSLSPNSIANPTNLAPQQPQQPSQSESRAKTSVNFTDISHSFGEIKQDSKNTYVFKFTNTGSQPLIIENATGSCGCTVPTYPKEPIAPGKTGEIEVVYSPGKQEGEQTKTVSITANTDPIVTTLNISAKVIKVN
ncbi:MAG: hypothetical protein A3K10_06020 [Bacteroidetes bacterium RIFCSPLOWO2_12_FULL_31_6]|nr:MAG: hypothetical protein A3K10_06020 [Bacteroidetes bacterium RIFCSPLOWO2_12_FULL_31_6]